MVVMADGFGLQGAGPAATRALASLRLTTRRG